MKRFCPRIHIVGRRNAGKTTLVCDLVRHLTTRGLAVATIKHTHHSHELDTPGKDSWMHRQAGASAVGILAAELTAIYLPETRSQDPTERYRRLQQVLVGFDLIIVEGDLETDHPKLEVWRAETGELPYAVDRTDLPTVITDDLLPDRSVTSDRTPALQRIKRSEIAAVADEVLRLAEIVA